MERRPARHAPQTVAGRAVVPTRFASAAAEGEIRRQDGPRALRGRRRTLASSSGGAARGAGSSMVSSEETSGAGLWLPRCSPSPPLSPQPPPPLPPPPPPPLRLP